MRLTDYITPELTVTDLRPTDGRDLLRQLVDHVRRVHPEVDGEELLARLIERERASSTGVGSGVAVPHATLSGPKAPICVVARLAEPLDFGCEAGRGGPVQLIFLVVSRPQDMGTHVRLLARIARLCAAPGLLGRLTAAPDAAALHALLREEDERRV